MCPKGFFYKKRPALSFEKVASLSRDVNKNLLNF